MPPAQRPPPAQASDMYVTLCCFLGDPPSLFGLSQASGNSIPNPTGVRFGTGANQSVAFSIILRHGFTEDAITKYFQGKGLPGQTVDG